MTFQSQKEGISANEVLAGNGRESLGSWVRQAPMLLKQSAPKTEQSLVNVCKERVSVKPNQKKKHQNSPIREAGVANSLATKDKFEDGRFIGPNYLSPC